IAVILGKKSILVRDFIYAKLSRVVGVNLIKHLSTNPDMPLAERIHIIRQIVANLLYLHEKGYHYLDLKPENILYDAETRTIKFVDWDSCQASDASIYTGSIGTPIFKPSHSYPDTAATFETYQLAGLAGLILSVKQNIAEKNYDSIPLFSKRLAAQNAMIESEEWLGQKARAALSALQAAPYDFSSIAAGYTELTDSQQILLNAIITELEKFSMEKPTDRCTDYHPLQNTLSNLATELTPILPLPIQIDNVQTVVETTDSTNSIDIIARLQHLNPELVTDEIRQFVLDYPRQVSNIDYALNKLSHLDPKVITPSLLISLMNNAYDASLIVDGIALLYQAETTLICDENIILLSLHARVIIDPLIKLHALHATLITNANIKLLIEHANDADNIVEAFKELCQINVEFKTDENFKFIATNFAKAKSSIQALKDLHKINPIFGTNTYLNLLISHASQAKEIGGMISKLYNINPCLIVNNEICYSMLISHTKYIKNIGCAISHIEHKDPSHISVDFITRLHSFLIEKGPYFEKIDMDFIEAILRLFYYVDKGTYQTVTSDVAKSDTDAAITSRIGLLSHKPSSVENLTSETAKRLIQHLCGETAEFEQSHLDVVKDKFHAILFLVGIDVTKLPRTKAINECN
ncbi:MAG: protein kinase domain-containing protein, partial [Gammaproteobacteria bacterium]